MTSQRKTQVSLMLRSHQKRCEFSAWVDPIPWLRLMQIAPQVEILRRGHSHLVRFWWAQCPSSGPRPWLKRRTASRFSAQLLSAACCWVRERWWWSSRPPTPQTQSHLTQRPSRWKMALWQEEGQKGKHVSFFIWRNMCQKWQFGCTRFG